MFSIKGFAKDHPFGFELAMQAGLALIAGAGTYAVKAVMNHFGVKDPEEEMMDKKVGLFAAELGVKVSQLCKEYGPDWNENEEAVDKYAAYVKELRVVFK